MKLPHLLLAPAVATTLLLAGCGADAGSDDSDAGGGAPVTGSFPQTIETKFGPVTVEEAPTRVVALGWADAETALALDVQPVGASDWVEFGGDGVGPWAEDAYDEPPEIIETLEPSYEKIAALEPDLILDVRGSGEQERYGRLSQIATTIGVPEGGDNYLTDMGEQVEMIATALGVPEKGEELVAEMDAAYKKVAEDHPEWDGKTVTAATRTSEGWGAYIKGGGRVERLERFGFTQNQTIEDQPVGDSGFSVPVSEENLDLLEADLIVAFPIYIETSEITDDPQWKRLETVQDGRAVVIDGDISAAYSLGSPQASLYTVEALTPLLEEALPK